MKGLRICSACMLRLTLKRATETFFEVLEEYGLQDLLWHDRCLRSYFRSNSRQPATRQFDGEKAIT
jgi:hypothetical protein